MTGDLINRIRARTQQHPELQLAHHFLFDLPLSGRTPEFVVLGINPGECHADWALTPGPTEETREHDFHTEQLSAGAKRWRSTVQRICGTDAVTLTQTFFWSSPDVACMQERFGWRLEDSSHLEFCRDVNRQLLDRFQPRAVACPGLILAELLPTLYELNHTETIRCPETGHRLVEAFHDGFRPWLVTKHWSGGFGFSRQQRAIVSDTIRKSAF